MIQITEELQCSPRELVLRPAKNTWWEIGTDGQSYATTIDAKVYKKILSLKGSEKGSLVMENVRYGYTIIGS